MLKTSLKFFLKSIKNHIRLRTGIVAVVVFSIVQLYVLDYIVHYWHCQSISSKAWCKRITVLAAKMRRYQHMHAELHMFMRRILFVHQNSCTYLQCDLIVRLRLRTHACANLERSMQRRRVNDGWGKQATAEISAPPKSKAMLRKDTNGRK